MGFLGKEPVSTPNLDRLASEGTTFTNMVSNYPVCSPYRAILFTGKYSYKNGVLGNCNSKNLGCELRDEMYCLSDALSEHGYSMGYIGKWHLQTPRPGDEVHGTGRRTNWDNNVWDCYTPPGRGRHGFDFWHSYGCCDEHNNPHYWHGDAKTDEAVYPGKWSPIHETDVAVDYIKNTDKQRDPDKPFALFLAYNPPHMPFEQVPKEYVDLYADKKPEELLVWENAAEPGRSQALGEIKNYYAMISGVDEQFGRVLDCLDEQGLSDDTIVIFTSDHGDMMGSQGLLRKGPWYNESLLVPFVARFPGRVRAGAQDDALLSAVDLFPTLMGLSGLADKLPDDLDGRDYSARLKDGESQCAEAALYLFPNGRDTTNGRRGLKTDRYTFALEKKGSEKSYFLIDNKEDPHQLKNIYGEDPGRDEKFRKQLKEMLIKSSDPFASALD